MTTYHIEAFLILANTLNYTKASAYLHTTQPNLSKIIVNLEHEVGAQLFNRSKRDVKLTPAGEVFNKEIRISYELYLKAIERAQEANAGVRGSLNIGFLGTAIGWMLPNIVNHFRKLNPDIHLNLLDYTYSDLIEAMRESNIDIALTLERELDRIPKLEKQFIFSDDMCLVVNVNHRFAEHNYIDLAQVISEPFVMMDPQVSIRDYEMVDDICSEHDFTPIVAYEANTLNSLLLMVECNVGISILASHMSYYASENIRFIRIKGYESYFRVTCAWRENANPCIPNFLRIIDDFIISNKNKDEHSNK